MQIRSRDVLLPKKFKIKNGKRLCLQSLKFLTIRLVKMMRGNKLRLAFVKYVISFENIRHFVLVPSSPMKMIHFLGLLFKIILRYPSTEMMYLIVSTS